jgi:hypothetical protein
MDPRLFDVIWEVSREVAGDKTIHVVCGYRSPATNAMLRQRSSGVAKFSQHTLGKAMDFFIPGASLEELRYAGLRLQRGGVGYYPTSGSPFIHLDVGPVRHWPRMSHDQLAHVFSNGRTVHVPSDGRPLSGYAVALAEVEKRGATVPQQSLEAARAAGVETASAQSAPRKKSLLATLFNKDDEEEVADTAPPAPTPSRRGTFSLASVDPKPSADTKLAADTKPEPVRTAMAPAAPVQTVPLPAVRPPRPAPAPVAASAADEVATSGAGFTPAPASGRDDWTFAGLAEPPRPPAPVQNAAPPPRAPETDTTASTVTWPVRAADNDHVPLDMVLAYATQPQRDRDVVASAPRPEPMGDVAARAVSPVAAKAAPPRENITMVPKKTFVRPAAAEPIVRAKPVVQVANAGMRYDDPWLRAMILAPSLSDSMTATLYGEPDLTALRALMNKPTTSVAMAFNNDPYPGITADRFSGEAVVFLTTFAFPRRTASLQ